MAARWLTSTLALAVAVACLLAACGGTDEKAAEDPTSTTDAADTTFIDDGADANAVETDTQLLVSSLVSSIESQTFGDGVKAIYLPRSCVTVANDVATATAVFTFDRCLGPNGLRGVSGTVTAKYELETGSVKLDVTGAGIAVNSATGVAFTASATVSADASKRTMAWKSSISGDTAGKRAFSRSDDFTIFWQLGEACFGLDGKSEGHVKNRVIEIEVDSYRRCKFGCPEAGGKISVTNVAKSKTVAVSYDGTNRATFTNANGKDSTFLLLCVP